MQSVMNEEMEKVKGFPVDSNVPYTERLKILTGIVNPEDPQISATERRLVLQGVFGSGTKCNGMSWFRSTRMGWFRPCVW